MILEHNGVTLDTKVTSLSRKKIKSGKENRSRNGRRRSRVYYRATQFTFATPILTLSGTGSRSLDSWRSFLANADNAEPFSVSGIPGFAGTFTATQIGEFSEVIVNKQKLTYRITFTIEIIQ